MKTRFALLFVLSCARTYGQAASGNSAGQQQPMGAHDEPIIIGDGSVFVRLDSSHAGLATPGMLSQALNKQLRPGALLSHAHAGCTQVVDGACNSSCNKAVHKLTILRGYRPLTGSTKFTSDTWDVSDCDTVRIYLDQYDKPTKKWSPQSAEQMNIHMQYVAGFFDSSHTIAKVALSKGKQVDQEQAWVVQSVPALSPKSQVKAQRFETDSIYRLQRVELWSGGSQPVLKRNPIALSTGCSSLMLFAPGDTLPVPPTLCPDAGVGKSSSVDLPH